MAQRTLLQRLVHYAKILGPGVITGASDDDPSGISTYSIAGATTGYSMLWAALLTTPMMAVVQGMCARIAMVSGRGLMAAMLRVMPRPVALSLALIVVVANTFNAGADIAGMSDAARLLLPVPQAVYVVLFGAMLVVMQVWFSYAAFARVVKWLCVSLLAYALTAFVVHPPWLQVLRLAVVPQIHLRGDWVITLMGVLGTTITPYLFFWQAALEVEEEREMGRTRLAQRQGATRGEIADAHADVNSGMIFSNLVMFFIIVTTAATLGVHGRTIATAQDAALALRPLAGNFASVLFMLGMVGTGLLAIPALTASSAYVLADVFGFREGLRERPHRAVTFYVVVSCGIAIGMLMTLLHVDAIKALFWSAVLNGIASVPLIAAVIRLANDRHIMGRWRSSRLANGWAVLTLALMSVAAVATIWQIVTHGPG